MYSENEVESLHKQIPARFSCPCSKALRDIRDHIRSHTGERPFVCSYCNKSFAHRKRSSHTNSKAFKCEDWEERWEEMNSICKYEGCHFHSNCTGTGLRQPTRWSVWTGQKIFKKLQGCDAVLTDSAEAPKRRAPPE